MGAAARRVIVWLVVGGACLLLAPFAAAGVATLTPEADTFVRESDPLTAHGGDSSFDVYGGASSYGCGTGRAFGLLRFDLTAIPFGATVTGATLRLTSFTGFAYNGDPSHHAIFVGDDGWDEGTVTWNTRPADGIVAQAPPAEWLLSGVPLSTSPDNLGAADAYSALGCAGSSNVNRDFASTNLAAKVTSERGGDRKLSLEIFTIPCGTPYSVACANGGGPTGATEQSYFLRYHSKEATLLNAPQLIVTYAISEGTQTGPVFTVNRNGDTPTDSGCTTTDCTLREAVEAANGHANVDGPDTIGFALPVGSPQIAVASALPPLTDPVVVDGTTQPGDGFVSLNGDGAGAADGLVFAAGSGGSTVVGLEIRDFATSGRAAIRILSNGNSVRASTLHSVANGVWLQGGAASNVVGGTIAAAEGNLIYATDGAAIRLADAGAGNRVQGNTIGLDPSGAASPAGTGVEVSNTPDTVVGALAGPGDLYTLESNRGNVIVASSSPGSAGISILGTSTGTIVAGNFVGTDRGGSATGLGNAGSGIRVLEASGNQLGPGNTVAFNAGDGIQLVGGSGNRIVANAIHDNTGKGISLSSANGDLRAPTLIEATSSGSTATVSGSVSGAPGATYFVELFSNAVCDGPAGGEGRTYLDFVSVTLGSESSTGSFSKPLEGIPNGTVLTATSTNSATGDTSEFSLCATVGRPPVVTSLSLTGPAAVTAGAGTVPLANIPPSALIVPQATGTQAAPVNQSPVNQSPVNQLPINQLATSRAPVNQLPVNQSPVNQSGIGYFQELAGAIPALGDIALATIPLLRPGGWGALLAGTSLGAVPLQSVTLRQVFALVPLPEPLRPGGAGAITFDELDLAKSPLGSLPAMTIALGRLPLSSIPGVDWCSLFSGPPLSLSCSTPPSGTSLLSAALQGAPVNQSPVNQSPVNQSLIAALAAVAAPVNQLPVNQLPVNQSRLGQLPVNQLPLAAPVNQSPVNQLSLAAILAANAPVNQSPVNQLPVNQLPVNQSLIDCTAFDCTSGTLGQAYAAGAVRPGVTLGDLRRALAPGDVPDSWTVAVLREFQSLVLGDLLASLPQPNDLTLADVLALALFSADPESFSFEGLNIFDTGLSRYAAAPGSADYTATFSVQPDGGPAGVPAPVEVSVTIARTFVYSPGTSKLAESPAGCGAATGIADPRTSALPGGATKLTWSVTTTVGSSYVLCFATTPGIVLGAQQASLTASSGSTSTPASPASAAVVVGDTFEPGNDAPATAQTLTPSNFYLSYLTSSTDVDYYRFPVPAAGTRVTFHLSHLPADYDLVVYGPQQVALRDPGASLVPALDGAPLVDTGSELTHVRDALPSQTLDDVRLQPLPLVGVSASRNTDPEDVTVLSDGGGGSYTIQITSYNGDTSPEPYMLRATTEAPRAAASVPARSVTGTAGAPIGALPAGLNTLFVVDRQRLEGLYGASAASSVLGTLASNLASFRNLGFPSAVLSVDAYASVRSAYGAWDADPGNTDLANRVVRAINDVIDAQVRQQPNGAGLEYVVLVGGDEVIPQARLGDFTFAANESGYADTFDRGSDLYAALRAGQMLSDDPYGATDAIPYLDRALYVPRLAVGRLIETPAEIVATLSRFTAFNGRLDPSTSLTTGYDFMQDGARAINGAFAGRFGASAVSLPTDLNGAATWSKADLLGAFLPAAGAPGITSLNGHADHFEFAPPSVAPPYFTSGDLPLGPATAPAGTSGPLANRLVFSMGCHSGLSVADAVVTGNTYDWAQAYAHNGVGAYLGNTGYGYGDSLVVAYSEQLDAIFARNVVAGATVGKALAATKQEYFGTLGVFGVYDEKAMAELTLYGLPMWSTTSPGGGIAPASTTSVATAAAPLVAATAPPTTLVTDAATGLTAEAFVYDGIASTRNDTAQGSYWSGPDGVQVSHLRPLQPKALVPVTGASGHGALITELRQQPDTPGVDPVFARPVVDTAANEPELAFGDVAFPSKLQALRTFRSGGALVQQVALVTGQFFTGQSPGVDGQGVQRLFTRIGARVLRSPSNDFEPPSFTRIEATRVGSTAAFAVNVTDTTQTGAAGTVKRVLVGLRSGNATTWTFSDLGQTTGDRWAGGIPLASPSDTFEYFVQAVDAAGNVGVSTNKGFYFAAAEPAPPSGNVTVAPAIPVPSSGWFTGDTPIVAGGPSGVLLEWSVDGSAFAPLPPQPTVSGDGTHLVEVRGSNGGAAATVVSIDSTDPVVTIGAPLDGAEYVLGSDLSVDFTCSDAGSGIKTCTGAPALGAKIDTSTVGTRTLTVTATDNLDRTTVRQVSFKVIWPFIAFASTRTGNGDIYRVDSRNGSLVRLTSGNAVDAEPAWSPDRKWIAFTSTRDGNPEIYVMRADGGNVTRLTTHAGVDVSPAWSPDGTKIAFASNRVRGNWDIYVIGATGGTVARLTTNRAADLFPAWSPDGTKLAFSSTRTGSGDIYTMNANGSSQTRVTTSFAVDAEPAWFGSTIAFSTNRNGLTNFEIYTMTATGAAQTRLTNSARPDTSPAWSPDGTRIAFASNRPGGTNFDIYVMDADGSGQTALGAHPAVDLFPDW